MNIEPRMGQIASDQNGDSQFARSAARRAQAPNSRAARQPKETANGKSDQGQSDRDQPEAVLRAEHERNPGERKQQEKRQAKSQR
jgi:hypothetical protein